jgi:glycerophosphoryl diester phosphodiesterase
MKKYLFILFLILLVSCNTSNPTFEIQNLNENKITVLGHRGMGKNHLYPGNTFESIYTALNLGADGSEIDVQVTKDSVLVIYHNKDLSSLTDFEGKIIDYNWPELNGCIYKSDDGSSYSVITVDELFNRIPNVQNYYFSFDLKLNCGDEDMSAYLAKFVYAINKVVDDYKMHNKIMIETGNREFHQMLKSNSTQVLQFITGSDIVGGIQIAKELDLYGIGIGSSITHKDVELARSNGLRVMTWIPKSKWGNVKAVRKNPDFIQTAKLEHMVQILDNPKSVD